MKNKSIYNNMNIEDFLNRLNNLRSTIDYIIDGLSRNVRVEIDRETIDLDCFVDFVTDNIQLLDKDDRIIELYEDIL